MSTKDIKKMIAQLDELYATNQEKRAQHAGDPMKYLDSEEALANHLHEI